MVFDVTRVNRNLPSLLCTFGKSFQRKILKLGHEMKLKNLSIKSNYVIALSVLNKSPKHMIWNDRWKTNLFSGGQETARWTGSEMKNLIQVQSS